MRTTILIAAALATGPAFASEPLLIEARPTAVISIADLDLASAHGKRLLNRRLNGAMEQVCGSYLYATEVAEQDRVTDCRAFARQSIDRQLAARATDIRIAAR